MLRSALHCAARFQQTHFNAVDLLALQFKSLFNKRQIRCGEWFQQSRLHWFEISPYCKPVWSLNLSLGVCQSDDPSSADWEISKLGYFLLSSIHRSRLSQTSPAPGDQIDQSSWRCTLLFSLRGNNLNMMTFAFISIPPETLQDFFYFQKLLVDIVLTRSVMLVIMSLSLVSALNSQFLPLTTHGLHLVTTGH